MMTWGIFHRCDICASNVKIAPLSNHQQRLIVKLYHILYEQYANSETFYSLTLPQQICECCFLRIEWLLKNLFKNLFQYSNGNMQTNPHLPKQGEVANEIPKDQPHEYNCDCQECQTKFGSLPLLVQVIEGQEKSSQEPSASSSLTVPSSASIPMEQRNTSLSEPSTSYASTSNSKKTMMCPHCNKNFTHRGDLNKHLRKHTGEQPYTCHVCKRKFAHTSNLNRHLKVHSGDRPFECSVCNKNFSRKDKLEMHKKTKLCKKFGEKM